MYLLEQGVERRKSATARPRHAEHSQSARLGDCRHQFGRRE
jgi:hypothetical protein